MSRIIEVLKSIRNGTTYTGEALSKIEAILKSVSNKSAYTDELKSRHEVMLSAIKKGSAVDLHPRTRIEEILVAIANGTLDSYLVGKNLFDISKVQSNQDIKNNGDGKLTIASGSYYTKTGITLRELCPLLKVGDTCILQFATTATRSNFIYVGVEWYSGEKKVITSTMLDAKLVLYGFHDEDEEYGKECVISNFKIEKGSTQTPYSPYAFGGELEEAYCMTGNRLKGG